MHCNQTNITQTRTRSRLESEDAREVCQRNADQVPATAHHSDETTDAGCTACLQLLARASERERTLASLRGRRTELFLTRCAAIFSSANTPERVQCKAMIDKKDLRHLKR